MGAQIAKQSVVLSLHVLVEVENPRRGQGSPRAVVPLMMMLIMMVVVMMVMMMFQLKHADGAVGIYIVYSVHALFAKNA
jgi:hypothetical protein